MNKRQNKCLSATLLLLLAMAIATLPLTAKLSPRDRNSAVTEITSSNTTTAVDRSAGETHDATTTTSRNHVRQNRHHNGNKKRGVIISATALTGMIVGASVAGPVGALAGAGVGAGLGVFLAHVF